MQPSQAGLSLSKLDLRNLVSRARRLSCSALQHPVSDGPLTLPLWLVPSTYHLPLFRICHQYLSMSCCLNPFSLCEVDPSVRVSNSLHLNVLFGVYFSAVGSTQSLRCFRITCRVLLGV